MILAVSLDQREAERWQGVCSKLDAPDAYNVQVLNFPVSFLLPGQLLFASIGIPPTGRHLPSPSLPLNLTLLVTAGWAVIQLKIVSTFCKRRVNSLKVKSLEEFSEDNHTFLRFILLFERERQHK